MSEIPKYKITLLGSSNVGKTSLINRFTRTQTINTNPTTCPAFVQKTMMLDGKPIMLRIWDTCGAEHFYSVTQSFYRGTDAFIIVVDLTDERSIEDLSFWLDQITHVCERASYGLVIAANKIDCENQNHVAFEEKLLSLNESYPIVLTSAKSGENIKELFAQAGRLAVENDDRLESKTPPQSVQIQTLRKSPSGCC